MHLLSSAGPPAAGSATHPLLLSPYSLSSCPQAAQADLSDTLFALAASNWSAFLLATLPAFVDGWVAPAAGLGPSERGALLALWGAADLDTHSFEQRLRLFANDCAYLERAAA